MRGEREFTPVSRSVHFERYEYTSHSSHDFISYTPLAYSSNTFFWCSAFLSRATTEVCRNGNRNRFVLSQGRGMRERIYVYLRSCAFAVDIYWHWIIKRSFNTNGSQVKFFNLPPLIFFPVNNFHFWYHYFLLVVPLTPLK